jgi:hypothetical protein
MKYKFRFEWLTELRARILEAKTLRVKRKHVPAVHLSTMSCKHLQEFGLAKYLCSYFPNDFFTCRKILQRGAPVFTSPPREGVLRFFIALQLWIQWQAR